jgi:hypothetical protein
MQKFFRLEYYRLNLSQWVIWWILYSAAGKKTLSKINSIQISMPLIKDQPVLHLLGEMPVKWHKYSPSPFQS